jgi:MFS transporter, DHA2 family, multidrug resistance protein
MTGPTRVVNPWLIAVTVTLATFMELLDTSIANVSLPYIGGGLGRSYDEVTWILTTYLVANAVVLPMSAWLSRVFGRKNYYTWIMHRISVPGAGPSSMMRFVFE